MFIDFEEVYDTIDRETMQESLATVLIRKKAVNILFNESKT